MKQKLTYTDESFERFILSDNWLEPPFYHNNKGKVLRFDLTNKPETESYLKICEIVDDLFVEDSYLYVVFYGTKNINWRRGKDYFNCFSLKKIFKKRYISRDDVTSDESPYFVLCQTKRKQFKTKKFFMDYLRGEMHASMAFISRKKGVALNFYDHRGFDLLCDDNDFLKLMYRRHEGYIIEYNREEILAAINKQVDMPTTNTKPNY